MVLLFLEFPCWGVVVVYDDENWTRQPQSYKTAINFQPLQNIWEQTAWVVLSLLELVSTTASHNFHLKGAPFATTIIYTTRCRSKVTKEAQLTFLIRGSLELICSMDGIRNDLWGACCWLKITLGRWEKVDEKNTVGEESSDTLRL